MTKVIMNIFSVGGKINAYRVFVDKLAEMRSVGRPRPKFQDNIKMNLEKQTSDIIKCINLTQHSTYDTVMGI